MTGVFLHLLWPLTFNCSQPRSSSDSQPPETSILNAESTIPEVEVELSPPADSEQEVPFTEVHSQLAPSKQKEEEEEEVVKEQIEDEKKEEDEERRVREEEVSEEYALSSTLRVEEKEDEDQQDEEQQDEEQQADKC